MKAKSTALLLADLGVTCSHSRPLTSNDNPFSESQFKNLKYQPLFPKSFGCIIDARGFCRNYFGWYNGYVIAHPPRKLDRRPCRLMYRLPRARVRTNRVVPDVAAVLPG